MADLRNTRLSSYLRTRLLNAQGLVDFNGALIDVMSGAQPATPETAIGAQVLLVTMTMNAVGFPVGGAAAGVATANAITAGVAVATGVAAWIRIWNAARTQVLLDAEVGASTDANTDNLELPSTAISSGVSVGTSSMTLTLPMQGL